MRCKLITYLNLAKWSQIYLCPLFWKSQLVASFYFRLFCCIMSCILRHLYTEPFGSCLYTYVVWSVYKGERGYALWPFKNKIYFRPHIGSQEINFSLGYHIGVPTGVPLKKYRPGNITVKELKSKIRGWKKKKLSQVNVRKNCELRRIKANFL